MTKITIIAGDKLTKFIDDVCTNHKKVEGQIHVAAVSCLFHANEHRNADMMMRLMAGLGGSVRRNALIAWAVEYGKLEATADGKSVQFAEKAHEGDDVKLYWEKRLELAMGKPFWDFKPEAPFQAFDLNAQIQKLIKSAEKAANDERNNVPTAELLALRKLALGLS